MADDEILTVKELETYLRIAEKTVYHFASEGRLSAFKVGGAWRFPKSETSQWTKEQSTGGKNESGKE